jgi:signal transduction histidine kinase
MVGIHFIQGLIFFSLGLVISLEERRSTDLPFAQQLPWLALFGFSQSMAQWADLALVVLPNLKWAGLLNFVRAYLFLGSGLFLLRFGGGLLLRRRPFVEWPISVAIVTLIPAALLVGYSLVVAVNSSVGGTVLDPLPRYLFYLPGCLLSGIGFLRARKATLRHGQGLGGDLFLGAALAFFFNASSTVLIMPGILQAVAMWLYSGASQTLVESSAELCRTLSALGVAVLVVRSWGVFREEHDLQLARLREAREQSQLRSQEVAEAWRTSLVHVGRRIARLEDIDQVLNSLVVTVTRLLDCDAAALGLWDAGCTRLMVKACAPKELLKHDMAIEGGIILECARMGRSTTKRSGEKWRCPVLDSASHEGVIAPLNLEEVCLGALWAMRTEERPFTQDAVESLESLSDQAVIALQHASMAAELQSLAITQERERIAREMHDNLAQLIGFLSVQLQSLEVLMHQGRYSRVLQEISLAQRRVAEADAEVRQNIICLRTTLSRNGGLISSLNACLQEFGAQTGIQAVLAAPFAEPIALSPIAETHLVRIIQEALSNVRKHSHANRVEIGMRMHDDRLHISIEDNGEGFLQEERAGHFGLSVMQERAEEAGGRLNTYSEPGIGTRVELWLPLIGGMRNPSDTLKLARS